MSQSDKPIYKYFIHSSNTNTHIVEIQKEQYLRLKSLFNKLRGLENILLSYQNVIFVKDNYDRMNKQIIESADINKGYSLGAFMLSSYSFMSRALVDNLKSLARRSKNNQATVLLEKYEKDIDNTLLKIIRNYSQHTAIPIDNVRKTYDVLESTTSIEYLLNRDKIIKGIIIKTKEYDTIPKLKKHFEKEIDFNSLIAQWQKNLDVLIHESLIIYGASLPSKEVECLRKQLSFFLLDYGSHKVDSIFKEKDSWFSEKYVIERDKLLVLLDYIPGDE